MTWLVVVALGAVGSTIRFVAADRVPPLLGIAAVNVAAAFALGLSSEWSGVIATGVQVGLLGAMSTWSTFAYQVAELLRDGRRRLASFYLGGTLIAGVAAAWIGLTLA